MKYFTLKARIASLLMIFLFFSPFLVSADPVDPCVDPELYCPVDSWLYVLLIAGILYGARKAYVARKKATGN
ncbi:MAG: hypothetical protein ACTHJN_08280 [Ginsengibacter sp.]|jgi:hypothetical protein